MNTAKAKNPFTAEEYAVLEHHRESWRDASQEGRKEITVKAWEEIKEMNQDFPDESTRKRKLKKVCGILMYLNVDYIMV